VAADVGFNIAAAAALIPIAGAPRYLRPAQKADP